MRSAPPARVNARWHRLAQREELGMWKRAVIGLVFVVACGGEEGPSAAEQGASVEQRNQDCAGLGVEQCNASPGCRMIAGEAVDEARGCLGERMELGCAASGPCDLLLTTVRDARGARWVLNDSCSPAGFVLASEPNATDYASCVDAPKPSECTPGFVLLTPGCSEPKPTWKKGCYTLCQAVGDDSVCAPGFTCQQTWIDPCVLKPGETIACEACGAQATLCLPSK